MSSQIEAKVPDIGNYHDVPVIELLVRPGDVVKKDQGLVTLESDKATMEVPAPVAGVVKALQVKLDDKVSEGAVIALLEAVEAARSPTPAGRGTVAEVASARVDEPSSGSSGQVPSTGSGQALLPGGTSRTSARIRLTDHLPRIQFSQRSPGTRRNSRRLSLTSTRSRAAA